MTEIQEFVRIIPLQDKPAIVIVSNNADCVEAALEVVRTFDAVENIELRESIGYPEVAPSSHNNTEQSHGPFKYQVSVNAEADRDALATKMDNGIQGALNERGLKAAVVVGE
jgi:hypothetical protein